MNHPHLNFIKKSILLALFSIILTSFSMSDAQYYFENRTKYLDIDSIDPLSSEAIEAIHFNLMLVFYHWGLIYLVEGRYEEQENIIRAELEKVNSRHNTMLNNVATEYARDDCEKKVDALEIEFAESEKIVCELCTFSCNDIKALLQLSAAQAKYIINDVELVGHRYQFALLKERLIQNQNRLDALRKKFFDETLKNFENCASFEKRQKFILDHEEFRDQLPQEESMLLEKAAREKNLFEKGVISQREYFETITKLRENQALAQDLDNIIADMEKRLTSAPTHPKSVKNPSNFSDYFELLGYR